MKPARLPWAEPGSRFTILLERFAIAPLQATQKAKGRNEILRTYCDQPGMSCSVLLPEGWREGRPKIFLVFASTKKRFAKVMISLPCW
jgi:hypothetical protein